jgi:hypothetical protein
MKSPDSVVGIATCYGLDDRGVGVQVPVGVRIFTSPNRPDRLWVQAGEDSSCLKPRGHCDRQNADKINAYLGDRARLSTCLIFVSSKQVSIKFLCWIL